MINHKFTSPEKLKDEVAKIVNRLSESMITRVPDSWISRLNASVEFKGQYIE
jgi:hypothetical protein